MSLLAFGAVSDSERRLAALKLNKLAGTYQQMLNADLERAIDVLHTLRAYHDNSDSVERREFESFARDLRLRLPGLRGAVWAKRVDGEERAAFEQSQRDAGFHDFEIWERDADGNRRRAADRDVYYAIVYSDPPDIARVRGFDLLTEPHRADAMARSRASDAPTATWPISTIYQSDRNRFLTFLPVYPKTTDMADGAPEPSGYMSAAFSTSITVENILQRTSAATGLDMYFFNPGASGAERDILWHPSRTRATPIAFPGEDALRAGPHWEGEIKVADRSWGAIFTPTPELAASQTSWQAHAVLLAGLALTAAIVIYMLASLKRTLKLEFLTESLRETGNQLQRESALVAQLASLDSMTGIANRASFHGRLAAAFVAAQREDGHFAVLCLDLDHFKDVNDTLGHPIGDRLLQIAATRLTRVVSHDDVIARLGGDEFALLIFDVSDRTVIAGIATRIVNALNESYDLDGNIVRVTASIGISVFGRAAASPEDMMIHADQALYRAKADGRNGYYFHCAELDREVRERVTINEELQAALRNGEFVLHYQPQVEVPSGKIDGLEALIRWQHPKRGLLYPGAFLAIAETTGMIAPMGRFVLEEACRQIKRWQAAGPQSAAGGDQHLRGAAQGRGAARPGTARNPHPPRGRSGADRDRTDRIRAGGIHQGQSRPDQAGARTRRLGGDRRFRHRLFVAGISAHLPRQPAENPAAIHDPGGDRGRRRRDRPRRPGAGARTRHERDRRGRRNPGATRLPARRRLPPRPGLLLLQAAAGRRTAPAAASRPHRPRRSPPAPPPNCRGCWRGERP